MVNFKIQTATVADANIVTDLVTDLLLELDPEEREAIIEMELSLVTRELIRQEKITALLAIEDEQSVGVVTLQACAAIYAGGVFVEI